MKNIIVAYDKNRGIGAANDVLWVRDLPADLRHFKELTAGSTVIMGRNTYESIGHPLPNRHNIVISRQDQPINGATVVSSLQNAYDAALTEDVFIIGGGQIYMLALETVDQIFATEVDASFTKADVFFPVISSHKWLKMTQEHHDADESNKYSYDFVIYRRK